MSQKERNNREDKDNNDEIITNYENENRELNRVVEKERNNAASAIRELTQVKSKLAIASNEKECLENEIQKLKRNMDLRSYGGHD